MDEAVFLFQKTIDAMRSRLKVLKGRFGKVHGIDPTGASSRLLDPDRVSLYEDMCAIEDLLPRSRRLKALTQNKKAELGHKVTLRSKSSSVKFHLCSDLDMKYLSEEKDIDGRMLTVESRLGSKLMGKKVGDEISNSGEKFTVDAIEVSELL